MAVKLEDFLAAHHATSLEDLDERKLRDLRAFVEHRIGRTTEDAAETRKPRLRGRAAEFARLVERIDEHMRGRGLDPQPQG